MPTHPTTQEAQEQTMTEPTDDEIDAVVQACRERGLREIDVFRAVLAKWGTRPCARCAANGSVALSKT